MRVGRLRFALGAKLLVLLLAFGAIPLAAAIAVGYGVGRAVVTSQAQSALRELGARQAVHVATELARQRLLLRTIAGQFPAAAAVRRQPPAALAEVLAHSLPDEGVFDGLRLVGAEGRVLAAVALRRMAPMWPQPVPAADWREKSVVVHWSGERAVAYLIAVPVPSGSAATWLEGHVRAEDFKRIFAMPTHLVGPAESALLDRAGRLIVAAHPHAAQVFARGFAVGPADSLAQMRANVGGTPSLVVTARVAEAGWVFAAALPLRIALAPLAQLRDAAVVAAGFLVLIIALTAVLAARSVSTPLRSLALAARRFGRGEPYQAIPPSGTDEVDLLVEAFAHMAQDLRRSREEIERLHAQEMGRAQQLATVGELASGIAHEIRNPLTGVLGALELALRRLPPGDAARPLLAEAEQQLRRIETTTSQLLRYARPAELRAVVVETHSLVERAARVLEAQARACGIAIEIEPAPLPAPVRVDPELMVQVLVNLMLNGIQAMSDGGRLTVWVARHPPEVWIGTRDTGPGVPAEARAEIFRPFYTTKHQGTGLGLPISRQIVERHGGGLRVEDTPGGGATFIVWLPLLPEEESST